MSRFYPKWTRSSRLRVHWRARAQLGRLPVTVSQFFVRSNRPLVFAHRGGAALGPENTLAAFDQGLALGSDGLELDVRLSRDGVVVVHHDSSLERTTDAPKQGFRGAPNATLEMEPGFVRGLDAIRAGQEIIILTWLHEAGPQSPRGAPS